MAEKDILQAIGKMAGKVDTLCDTVKEQGQEIGVFGKTIAEMRATCIGRLKVMDGLAHTLYGSEGRTGVVGEVNEHRQRLEGHDTQFKSLENGRKERRQITWKILAPLIVTGIVGIISAGFAIWRVIT